MINRIINEKIRKTLFKGKAIILMGCRQIGKTTSLNEIFSVENDVLWLSGDDSDTRDLFENITSDRLKTIFGNKKSSSLTKRNELQMLDLNLS